MPELPEVETTRRGIAPHIVGKSVIDVVVRQPRLRWPVTAKLDQLLKGSTLRQITRRAKYLLLQFDQGTLLIHLGMSGSLRLVPTGQAPEKHDHVDISWSGNKLLRFTDPRRFGAILWLDQPPDQHPLLNKLGPEPLSDAFTGEWLYQRSRGRRISVKQLIMDQKVVTGVGNIYANEALFKSGILPSRQAGRIAAARYERLAENIKQVLAKAIKQGGTTLRDFVGGDGKPGYFQQQLQVYGREGEDCNDCGSVLKSKKISGRASVYCPQCQH